MKFYVNGMDLRSVRNKIFLPWMITYCVLAFTMLFLFLRYKPSLILHLEIVLFAAILYFTAVSMLSLFQYVNRHRIKLFIFDLGARMLVIERDGEKETISFDNIKEVQYRSGKFFEVRGFSVKSGKKTEGVSCFGDRLNLCCEKDILQFDEFFDAFEEKTKYFLEERGSEYGKAYERIRLKRKSK